MAPRDRSAPGVRLALYADAKATSGTPLDFGMRLLGLTFEDCDDKADKLTLQLDNFDLSLLSREELMGGAILEASWGYPGAMSPPRRCLVRSLKGFQQLTIEAQSLGVLIDQVARTRGFEGMTRSAVVRAIAREHGFDDSAVDVEDTTATLDVLNQAAETDARFLRRLAAREGFVFYVDASGLHWRRRRLDTPPTHVFTWYGGDRGDLLSVNVDSDLVKRAGSVTVQARDPIAKTTVTSSSSAATASRPTLGDVVEVVDPTSGASSILERNATASVASSSAATPAGASREAEARFVAAEREAVKLTVMVVGDPTIEAKTIVELRGISPLLSGKYYVIEAKHLLQGGAYTCELKLRRDGKGRTTGATAADAVAPQTGEKNTATSPAPGAPRIVERVDPETGLSCVAYDASGAVSSDPEAQLVSRAR
ncbi:MAG: phage late control D family protein [Polyangiales bacterium]